MQYFLLGTSAILSFSRGSSIARQLDNHKIKAKKKSADSVREVRRIGDNMKDAEQEAHACI